MSKRSLPGGPCQCCQNETRRPVKIGGPGPPLVKVGCVRYTFRVRYTFSRSNQASKDLALRGPLSCQSKGSRDGSGERAKRSVGTCRVPPLPLGQRNRATVHQWALALHSSSHESADLWLFGAQMGSSRASVKTSRCLGPLSKQLSNYVKTRPPAPSPLQF